MTSLERTLVIVKPDGYRRGLTGEVLRRIEAKGYTLAALAVQTPDRERLAQHYAEHEGKPFYEPLIDFMSSGPATFAIVEGHRCIEGFRALAGATWAATGAKRCRPTSCTAPTHRSRPSARSVSGSAEVWSAEGQPFQRTLSRR